jgi:hypothetical protein
MRLTANLPPFVLMWNWGDAKGNSKQAWCAGMAVILGMALCLFGTVAPAFCCFRDRAFFAPRSERYVIFVLAPPKFFGIFDIAAARTPLIFGQVAP